MIVFANDSLAWLFGITLGKHRGLFKVSPNKSLEGFIAGMAGSIIATLLGPVLFPFIPARWALLVAMGLVCGITGVAGDLFESALKRSAGVKDSGRLIPGRGGFLDSFDSILFTAPTFVAFLLILKIIA
jgi:phosphatidate cytidylyltransferase